MKVFFYFVILLLMVEGCISPSIITTSNITQPVLVGNVKNIGGKPIDKKSMNKSDKFNASITNSYVFYFAIFIYGWRYNTEGSNTFDKQLLPIMDTVSNNSTALIMVDDVDFSTASYNYLFYISTGNYGQINGTKYEYSPKK